MSSLKTCPGCGRQFLRGRHALVKDGARMRDKVVCFDCSSKCVRVLTTATSGVCKQPTCFEPAAWCAEHAREMKEAERLFALRNAIAGVQAILEGYRHVRPLPGDEPYVRGRIDGLESALEVLERKGPR